MNDQTLRPKKYPARQSLQASQAIARLHGLSEHNTVFAQQNPAVIDQGVFHNDVIAVGTTQCLFHHELAFHNSAEVIDELQAKLGDVPLSVIEVANDAVQVNQAVSTYLFNTQLLDVGSADAPSFLLIAPSECKENSRVHQYLQDLVNSDQVIDEVIYFNLTQSMKNGGGPACLRLRVTLNQTELDSIEANVLMHDQLYEQLVAWVNQYYRDRLSFEDLRDPQLIDELKQAAQALEEIIGLPGLYQLN